MKVVIIGSGNVATALGRTILTAGHVIVQVAGRNRETVVRLAEEWGAHPTTGWGTVDKTADIYLVALSDSALPGLGKALSLPSKLVLHTSGALPADTLRDVTDRAGVLYPLQSFGRGIAPPEEFPLLIDAVRPEDIPLIRGFAGTLATQVVRADDAVRLKLHVAAVLVNNFTNHLYTLAADFCRQENIDFHLLLPLIRETARRVGSTDPRDVQTGPAIRGDGITLEKHRQSLSNYHNIKQLYDLFTILIEEYYRSLDGRGRPLE
ncbi:MAG TPA: DUF2520 domain-containing protein [Puia sp.]|jgi:predicted short-subunit dehydrogenase-like oxidoreductase (DUF2520 family)|nr:DUF2520 domain-containing protein [Puia sp.]